MPCRWLQQAQHKHFFLSVKYLGILFQEIVILIYRTKTLKSQDIELKYQEQVDNDLERGNDDLCEFIILEIS